MRHIFFAVLLTMHACNTKSGKNEFVQYSGGRQLLTVNNVNSDGRKFHKPGIGKITPDSVSIGEEFLAKIFLTESEVIIADAFVDCQKVDNASVDTVTHKVSGCSTGLMVKDDTIHIGFRPTSAGLKTFPTITILTKDKEKIFRTMEYTFDYKVAAN